MANNNGIEKQGFVMYKSWTPMILAISDEDAGILFKAVCSFQTGQQVNIENPLLHGIFEMMKASFVQDDNRYREKCEKNARNGSKGGKAKAANATERKQPLPNATDCQKSVANLADIEKDMDMDIDSDIDSDIDKESDSDTETEMPADSSASVSVPSLNPADESELAEICRREHITSSSEDMQRYLSEMKKAGWKDAAGNKIRSVPAHFRDWLKRNASADSLTEKSCPVPAKSASDAYDPESGNCNTESVQDDEQVYMDYDEVRRILQMEAEGKLNSESAPETEEVILDWHHYKKTREIIGDKRHDEIQDFLEKKGIGIWADDANSPGFPGNPVNAVYRLKDVLKENGFIPEAEKVYELYLELKKQEREED